MHLQTRLLGCLWQRCCGRRALRMLVVIHACMQRSCSTRMPAQCAFDCVLLQAANGQKFRCVQHTGTILGCVIMHAANVRVCVCVCANTHLCTKHLCTVNTQHTAALGVHWWAIQAALVCQLTQVLSLKCLPMNGDQSKHSTHGGCGVPRIHTNVHQCRGGGARGAPRIHAHTQDPQGID